MAVIKSTPCVEFLQAAYVGKKCFDTVPVCLFVYVSVRIITFECLDIETSFWYGGTS